MALSTLCHYALVKQSGDLFFNIKYITLKSHYYPKLTAMLLTSLQQSPSLLISVIFILGLMVGSFLNVVIYR